MPPTKASEQFLDEIANHIADKACQSKHYIITGGDFNASFEPDLDCSGGRPSIKDCIKNLNDIMLQNDLDDINYGECAIQTKSASLGDRKIH